VRRKTSYVSQQWWRGRKGRAALQARFDQFSADGLRTLGIGTRLVGADYNGAVETDESDLTFAGFAVLLDPPKASAAEAIRELAFVGCSDQDLDRR